MLCCGRKKDNIDQDVQATHHRSLLDAGRGSAPRTITGSSGKQPKHLYSRSYPESEAVAFGGRPLLQGRDLDRSGRTADGKRQRHQRDCWMRNKFGGQQQQMLQQHQFKIAQKLQLQLSQQPSQQVDMGIKSIETYIDYTTVETVEINKRPGQTLGFYIREGNGIDRNDGVFISRIAAGSAVEQNGLLRVGEEILAIDGLSLKGVCLDDVVILMSIPSKLVLTVRTKRSCCKNLSCPSLPLSPTSTRQMEKDRSQQPQVYISKKSTQKQIDQPIHQIPHKVSLSRQFLTQSYQPTRQPLLYSKEQKLHKPHITEFTPDQTYGSYYARFPPPEFDAKHMYLPPKELYKYPGKLIDSSHDSSYEPYRRSRIEALQPDGVFERLRICDNTGKLGRKPQAESLDRRTNGTVLSRKYRSHDYYSDSEAQINGEYFDRLLKSEVRDWVYEKDDGLDIEQEHDKVHPAEKDETDDLAGIRELSRSLSRRRKAARLQMEKWRQQREQLNLERRIEEQQKQLYLLQQKLQLELQQQQIQAFSRPILQQNLSYPISFGQYREDYEPRYSQSKYISYYPALQHRQQRLEDGEDSLIERFEYKKRIKLKSDTSMDAASKEQFRVAPHRRRYSSDSEILQTSNGKISRILTSSPSTGLFAGTGLLMNGGKCNSLPADIENGSASNSDDPTQLKHWLRKLDRLSYDLRDFNHHNNRNKNGNKKDISEDKQKKNDSKIVALEFEKRFEKIEDKKKLKAADIDNKGETSERASYTSEEYKTWLSDRRLQSKLHKEKSEMFMSRTGARPISGRDRAKIALSESRQKVAHSHLGQLPSRHKKHLPQTSDFLKKKLTSSASQTTPTIDPEKRKSRSLDQEPREPRIPHHSTRIKSKTLDIPLSQDSESHETRETETHPSDLRQSQIQTQTFHHDLRHQLSLPNDEIFEGSPQLPDVAYLEDSQEIKKPKKKFGQRDQLKEEPLRIRVEDFHPHCARETVQKVSKRYIKDDDITQPDKCFAESSDAEQKEKGIDGLMYIKLFCGHGLKSSKRTIMRDLYCVISSDGINKARTATKTGALNFDWDEDFEIELDDAHLIGFSIYNWDPVARQKLCFIARLVISEFLSIHGNHRRLAMKLHPTGTLYVELLHKDLSERFSRVPILAEDAIFGVYLDEIVSRERKGQIITITGEVISSEIAPSGTRVPRIVRACVRQVELRGLDCVGIYRLCGSYDRLQKLKRDLERGALNEELLSVDNIPDINVVANVLKTFFQELPEPLLTSDLHQMFIDAINVQIETDPDGNASLMLSILDCLPKNSLAVFSFIMDHLKRIVQHKQFNRMNTEAVGGIFGPLLLCPPISNNKRCHKSLKQESRHSRSSIDLSKQAQVITYLLDIWPTK